MRPCSTPAHQHTGWTAPIEPPRYVDSSTLRSVRIAGGGRCAKLYHSSRWEKESGRCEVDGWSPAVRVTRAVCIGGWCRNFVPIKVPYHSHSCSVSAAEWIPANPAPETTASLSASLLSRGRTVPEVLRKTNTVGRRTGPLTSSCGSSVIRTFHPSRRSRSLSIRAAPRRKKCLYPVARV